MAGHAKPWTPEEDQLLRDYGSTMTTEDLMSVLGRSRHGIDHRCSILKINRRKPGFPGYRPTEELAWHIGRDVCALMRKEWRNAA